MIRRLRRLVPGLLAFAIAVLPATAVTQQPAGKKLQVVLMLGQSNMVGLAHIKTFRYLLQEPYRPPFEEVRAALASGVYYARIYSRYGWELGDRMRRDPEHAGLHPRDLRRLIRKTILETLPADQQVTERDLYDDMMQRLAGRATLRRRLAARFLPGTNPADFDRLPSLLKQVQDQPAVRADPAALRLAHAEAVRDAIHLPLARRTYIASYGAFQAPGQRGIRSADQGRLSIGWGSSYATIGPEYGFGIALEEQLDAPVLIIKCAWGNTALGGAWRPPSAPPRTETAAEKQLREARNAALAARAAAAGEKFKPFPAPHAPSPGWCWTEMKFQDHIRKVLADPGRYHPEYDPQAGYEVAGLVWFQGHSDFGYDSGKEYEQTMAHFIGDLRKLVGVPKLPVVIGTVSTDEFKARNDHSPVTRSQLAVARRPEFRGNVTTVNTLPFYPTELRVLGGWLKHLRQTDPDWRTSAEYARLDRYHGISNAGYHYMGSAEFFVEAGDAFAQALVALRRRAAAGEAPRKRLPLPGEVFEVAGRTAFLILPERRPAGRPTPWVWYAPTLPRLPGRHETWMFERFLAQGIAIAGIDVGESYGSPAGRALYSALHRELVDRRGLAPRAALLARSRGGLMLYNWAVEHPQAVACIAGIYPVCDLRSYPGLAKACGAYRLDQAGLAAQLDRHNPVARLAPLAAAGVPVFHIHGDSDRVVPLAQNSAAVQRRYRELGGAMELEVVAGRGHDLWSGWFRSQRLVDFVVEHATGRAGGGRGPGK